MRVILHVNICILFNFYINKTSYSVIIHFIAYTNFKTFTNVILENTNTTSTFHP